MNKKQEHTPLISVLVANYNNGCYIREMLDSVVAQLAPVEAERFAEWGEIVVVDDASTDASSDIIRAYCNEHPDVPVSVSVNSENRGCGFTKRRCIDRSKGTYFIFVDPDDVLLPDCIKVLYEGFNRGPFSIVYAVNVLCDEKLEQRIVNPWPQRIPDGESHFTSETGHISAPALCSRHFYQQTEGINPLYRVAEDQDLYCKMEEVAPVLFVQKPLYLYRGHNHNVSRNTSNDMLNAYWGLQCCIDTYYRRKKKKFVPNVTFRDLQVAKMMYYLKCAFMLYREDKYRVALRNFAHAIVLIVFDKHFRFLKTMCQYHKNMDHERS